MIVTDTFSTALLNVNTINYRIILPETFHQTLLWLHGYKERSEDILSKSNLEQLAERYQTAIILPDVPDTYYLNQTWNDCYTEDFLILEFFPAMCKKYQLPHEKEQTYIAGISMGGFGSLLLGSRRPDLFGKIICISGAFIVDDILIGNPEVIGSPDNFPHFQRLFGDFSTLDSCEKNPVAASREALTKKKLPPVYLACGTEDLLYTRNTKLRNLLSESGADITWREAHGNHNWKFFNSILEDIFTWMIR